MVSINFESGKVEDIKKVLNLELQHEKKMIELKGRYDAPKEEKELQTICSVCNQEVSGRKYKISESGHGVFRLVCNECISRLSPQSNKSLNTK